MKRFLLLLLWPHLALADGLITVNEPNAAQRRVPVDLVLASDHLTKATGLSASIIGAECRLYKPSGAGADCLGAFVEHEQGGYVYVPAVAELGIIGVYNLYVKDSTTDIFHGTFQVVPKKLPIAR